MFSSADVQLYYEIHGHGPRVLVFMHGILMDSNMNRRLATDLAARGFRVVLLDLPGHGLSEKPKRASFHRMDTYAEHVVRLMDHLGLATAAVGGVSLGGNVSLLVAAMAPERVQALVIEMPVLEWAVPAAAITFSWSARATSASLSSGPRAVLMRIADGFIVCSSGHATSPLFSAVSGQWSVTTSARWKSSGSATYSAGNSPNGFFVRVL